MVELCVICKESEEEDEKIRLQTHKEHEQEYKYLCKIKNCGKMFYKAGYQKKHSDKCEVNK